MSSIDTAILNALTVNMGHSPGERVAIVRQVWTPSLGEKTRAEFDKSDAVCAAMHRTFIDAGIDVSLIEYAPTEARNGADGTPQLYDAFGNAANAEFPIIFMPTAYSLTHTPFRKAQTDRGSRVASMPGFTLGLFGPGGAMDADYNELARKTTEMAGRLKESEYVRVTAPGTDIIVHVDQNLVHESSGLIREPGMCGNLPGAEAYAVPVHCGNSNGYITVPKGWGGQNPLETAVTLYIENGRFVDAVPADDASQSAQEYVQREVFPVLFGETDYNVLAELGIGTNDSVTPATVARDGWSILTAEKIGGSAHFANGNSKGMGGVNDVRVHVDWVVPDVTIEFGYTPK